MSRETRLLVVTITLSVLVLVLLSRFRFPDPPPITSALPAPLERLAARATYDELAAIVGDVQRRIAPSLVVLQTREPSSAGSRTLSDILNASPTGADQRHVPALRVSPTTAIAAIPPDTQVLGVVGQAIDASPPRIIAMDRIRQLALVELPAGDTDASSSLSIGELLAPAYVIVVEGTRAGLSVRPLFVGSSDQFDDPRWDRPLFAISSVPLTSPGALIFSTDGRFLGSSLVEGGTLALATAMDVVQSVEELTLGRTQRPLDAGIAVQPLTPLLTSAFSVPGGVVIADVENDSLADGLLRPTDVIVAMDGEPVTAPDDFLLRLGRARPGTDVALAVVRAGTTIDVRLSVPSSEPGDANALAGLVLSARREGGSLVNEVAPGSRADQAGLRNGDAIVMAADLVNPSPAQITKLSTTGTSRYLPLTIEREGRRLVTALAIAPDADASR